MYGKDFNIVYCTNRCDNCIGILGEKSFLGISCNGVFVVDRSKFEYRFDVFVVNDADDLESKLCEINPEFSRPGSMRLLFNMLLDPVYSSFQDVYKFVVDFNLLDPLQDSKVLNS